jgi:polar amino acid transport system ATP-binding protein
MSKMNDSETMIEVVDLHKRFKDLHVLKGISTTVVKQSEVVAIMGPSGGGKSTFYAA